MSDTSSHRHEHRDRTVARYEHTMYRVKNYLRVNPYATLGDFCVDKNVSRRQVQRALSYFDTSWRRLKSDG